LGTKGRELALDNDAEFEAAVLLIDDELYFEQVELRGGQRGCGRRSLLSKC
jgi:hypothetical protein